MRFDLHLLGGGYGLVAMYDDFPALKQTFEKWGYTVQMEDDGDAFRIVGEDPTIDIETMDQLRELDEDLEIHDIDWDQKEISLEIIW